MSLGSEDIQKIAHLARLQVSQEEAENLSGDVANILALVDQLQAADTDGVAPMANPHDAVQTLRVDEVSEVNQRDHYQSVAPATEDGLYLVPKVIE